MAALAAALAGGHEHEARENQPPARGITPAAIAAWRACDFHGLYHALGLQPWDSSPLPLEVTVLGVSADCEPKGMGDMERDDWQKAAALQHELLRVAGWPDCRASYEKNLMEAQDWRDYCQKLIDNPALGGQGTGCDPNAARFAMSFGEPGAGILHAGFCLGT